MRQTFKKLAIALAIILAVLIANYMIIGKTFTYQMDNMLDSYVSCEVIPESEDALRVVSTEYKSGKMYATIKGLKTGYIKVEFIIYGENGEYSSRLASFYVHKSGIITMNGYVGTTNRFYIIGIEAVLFLLALFIHRIWLCVRIQRDNMYSYALVGHMGVALFLFVTVILFTLLSIRQGQAYYTLSVLVSVLETIFAIYALLAIPILFVLAIFLLVSNLILIKREGRSLTNTLGILLGFGLLGMTLTGAFISLFVFSGQSVVNSPIVYYLSKIFDVFFFSVPVYLECLMASTLFCTLRVQRFVPKFDKDYVIILGCAIRQDGTVTPLLKGRADRALWFAKKQKEATGKELIFVPSGGKGDDEVISEAQAIKNYLLENGVDEAHILMEDKSTTTRENMEFSRRLIEEHAGSDAHVSFSTTGYHVFRSGNIARSAGLRASGMGSKTRWYFYVNALIREFAANLAAEKTRHIVNMIALMIYAILITCAGIYIY